MIIFGKLGSFIMLANFLLLMKRSSLPENLKKYSCIAWHQLLAIVKQQDDDN
jgi:hypothetical protein